MIQMEELTEKEKGCLVIYKFHPQSITELGKIKRWNGKYIFVEYQNGPQKGKVIATPPNKLKFA